MKLATFTFTTILTGAGAVLAGRISDDFTLAMAVTAAWFVAVSAVAVIVARRRRGLVVPIGAGLGVVVVAMTVLVGVPTLIGRTVDETVVVGAPAAAASEGGNVQRAKGRFVSIAHESRGDAAVVELPDGSRKLTLTRFETDPGPDLRVYLTTRDPADGGLGRIVDLGALKGNRGDQQYDVPAGLDLDRHRIVVVWCRAFSVPFTSAALRP